MPAPRLQSLHDAGQSLWLDYIDRPMLHNGELARRIRDDHPFFRVAMRDGIPVVGSPLQEIVHGTQRRTQAR